MKVVYSMYGKLKYILKIVNIFYISFILENKVKKKVNYITYKYLLSLNESILKICSK